MASQRTRQRPKTVPRASSRSVPAAPDTLINPPVMAVTDASVNFWVFFDRPITDFDPDGTNWEYFDGSGWTACDNVSLAGPSHLAIVSPTITDAPTMLRYIGADLSDAVQCGGACLGLPEIAVTQQIG